MSREKVLFQAETVETVTENIDEKISKEARENSQTENGVYVKGMALPFGETSRNGVQYEKQSVEENADELVGRPILFNHKQDFATGHILNIETTEEGMFYEGDINPNAEMPNGVTVAEAVERGDIRSPSIQAFIEQLGEEADEDAVIDQMETEKVAVKDFIEISMVTVPGFPNASAMPEHLQNQGVQPVTEIVGSNQQGNQEETEGDDEPNHENDEVNQEAPEFDDMGECISFHMDEKDMEQDQAVAVCMDKMNEEDLPEELQEAISKEQFEFAPVPTHVLYDTEEKARRRAENLGLEGIHEHQMGDQLFYMAGESHDAWFNAIERENSLDRNNTEDDNMSEQDNNEDKQEESEQSEQVSEQNFEEFVASHMEGADVADITEALSEYNFTGIDQGEVAALLAQEFDLDTGTVMDVIGDLEDMERQEEEEEIMDDDDDEDDEDEKEESEESREELEEKVESQSEKINELEQRLEKLLENDEGSSKQQVPSKDNGSETMPSFGDVL